MSEADYTFPSRESGPSTGEELDGPVLGTIAWAGGSIRSVAHSRDILELGWGRRLSLEEVGLVFDRLLDHGLIRRTGGWLQLTEEGREPALQAILLRNLPTLSSTDLDEETIPDADLAEARAAEGAQRSNYLKARAVSWELADALNEARRELRILNDRTERDRTERDALRKRLAAVESHHEGQAQLVAELRGALSELRFRVGLLGLGVRLMGASLSWGAAAALATTLVKSPPTSSADYGLIVAGGLLMLVAGVLILIGPRRLGKVVAWGLTIGAGLGGIATVVLLIRELTR